MLENASKKVLYRICAKVVHKGSLASLKASWWSELLMLDDYLQGSKRFLHKEPINKHKADLQW